MFVIVAVDAEKLPVTAVRRIVVVVMVLVVDGQLLQPFSRELTTAPGADVREQLERTHPVAGLAHLDIPAQFGQKPRLSLSLLTGWGRTHGIRTSRPDVTYVSHRVGMLPAHIPLSSRFSTGILRRNSRLEWASLDSTSIAVPRCAIVIRMPRLCQRLPFRVPGPAPFFYAAVRAARLLSRRGLLFCLTAGLSLVARPLLAAEPPRCEVRIIDDRLSVHAQSVPLLEVLQQFQEAGVRVRLDQRVNPLITADFENRDMYKGLEALLADCDYAIVWSAIAGPAGPMKRISQIDVFKPGDRAHAVPLPGPALKAAREPLSKTPILCVRNELLIRLKPGTPVAAFRDLLVRINGTVVDSVPALGIYRVRLAPGTTLAEALKKLATDATVAYAEPNLIYRLTPPTTMAGGRTTPPASTAGSPGAGAPVAILDTGWRPGLGLAGDVVASLDALDPERTISDPQGHGTQMALLAAGTVTPLGVSEVGGSVPVIPIRAFDENGYASSFALMNSMMFALDQKARVISLSWGSEVDSRFISDAVSYAISQGAVVVAAAGNTPSGQPFYPAAYPGVVAVSAILPSGEPWPSSNYGDFVTLAAPAVADLPVGYNGPPGGYAGTSIAAAYTANTIARYLALHPTADAHQAIAALTNAVTQASGTATRDPHIGAGRLDSRAVAALMK